MRVLFLSVHRPGRSPSQRFRFEQYVDWLRDQGWHCTHSWLLDADDDSVFYGRGALNRKMLVGLKAGWRRVWEIVSGEYGRYDIAFVQREAFFAGPAFVERAAQRQGAKLVFDLDDAIWIPQVSDANRSLGFLKRPGKVDDILARADLVFAGNPWLANHARALNARVEIVPTTIDTDEYHPASGASPARGRVCIGWSGSFSTIQHFKLALPVLRRVRDRFGDAVCFKVIGDAGFSEPELGIAGTPWRKETELDDLREIDIGLMPLPDDEWARGKCGLKGLQYMALGIPTLMSPVGVNAEIITNGLSGFLPRSDDEWFEAVARLIVDAQLRERIGMAGRAVVERRYSVRSWREPYRQLLMRVAGKKVVSS